jgi:hypothetical protein
MATSVKVYPGVGADIVMESISLFTGKRLQSPRYIDFLETL